jgi:ribonuclease G
MSKEIVINTDSQKTRIAIVENGALAELFIETEEYERTIGNIFLGRIRRIMPSIQAAFVDIGQKQDAFLHYSDLADNLADWLSFVQEESPQIGEFEPRHSQRTKGRRRRRPQHERRRSPHADSEDEREAADEGEKGQTRSDARARGRRRSAQRRRPAPARRERRDDDRREKPRSAQPAGDGLPSTLLKKDLPILVKISKEPIAAKGSRITTDISLAGRFLVLVPMADYVAVSKKISSFKERRRLRALARMLVPEGFGVIVRTVADGQNAKALDTDLRLLLDRWRKIEKRLGEHPKPPSVVHQDVNMVSSIIRDLFSDNYERILVDSPRLYKNVKSYIQAVAPEMVDAVKLHESEEPVFRAAGIDKKVAEAFEKRVNMPSGGYLFFEQTEAMHVIDVNSGRAGRGMSQEDSSLKVNLEAARIIARQIRIRDLGGIIVVDFIDMRDERSRRKVLEELKKEFRRDRAVTKLLPMSDFGLIQITRQRLRPSITTTFSELQDATNGEEAVAEAEAVREKAPEKAALPRPVRSVDAGDTLTPEQLVHALDEWIRAFRAAGRKDPLRLQVHPFVAAYLNRRIPSQATRWFVRFIQRVRIEAVPTIDPLAYRFLDGETGNDLTMLPMASAPAAHDEGERPARQVPERREQPRREEPRSSGERQGARTQGETRHESERSGRQGRGGGRSSGRRPADPGSGERRGEARRSAPPTGDEAGSESRGQEQGDAQRRSSRRGGRSGGSRGRGRGSAAKEAPATGPEEPRAREKEVESQNGEDLTPRRSGRRRGSRGGRGRSRGRSSGNGDAQVTERTGDGPKTPPGPDAD